MSEFFSKLNGGEVTALAAVVGGMLVAITGIIASQWRRVRVAELHGALKQQMLDKGMSAEEIVQVMNAGESPEPVNPVLALQASDDRAGLVQNMVEQGYEAADIERVLRAYQPMAKPIEEKPVLHGG